MRKIIFPLLTLLVGQPLTAREKTHEITVRTLCFSQVDGIKSLSHFAPRRKSATEVPLWVGAPSEDIELKIEGDILNFYILAKDEDGKEVKKIAAVGKAKESKRQLLLFLPAKEDAGIVEEAPYRILSFDDDVKSFPMGSIRLVNDTDTAVVFTLGEHDKTLEAGASEIVPQPTEVDEYNDYSFSVEIVTEEGRQTVRQTRAKAIDSKRDMAVIVLGDNERPSVSFYKDIPPWITLP